MIKVPMQKSYFYIKELKMTLKERGLNFLAMVVEGKIREAYALYVHENMIHHNAYFKGDRESLMLAMEEAHVAQPNKTFKVLRCLHDDNLVAMHSHIQFTPNEPGYVVVHIIRFEGEKIIEMWDLGQAIPAELPNENGML